MTPAARIATAIDLLDEIIAGAPAERSLTRWARASRYAGSRDRAAIRDIVFDVLRRRRSLLWRSGQPLESGRALLSGMLADLPEERGLALLDGSTYGKPPLSAEEAAALRPLATAPGPIRLDIPDALLPLFEAALGTEAETTLKHLRQRAPIHLRVNTLKATRTEAQATLAAEEIETEPLAAAETALNVLSNPRRIANSQAYKDGLVELQDTASQIAAAAAEARPGEHVLDFCAGGGGKALALGAAMQGRGHLIAHDANPARMRDIPQRAARAGVSITCLDTASLAHQKGQFDLVFVDAPCSGSGAWRRHPEGKWALSPEKLVELAGLQSAVLQEALRFLRPGGRLLYATCSVLLEENQQVIETLLERQNGLSLRLETTLPVCDTHDGFYFALLDNAQYPSKL